MDSNKYLAFKKVHQNWGTALYTRNMPLEELAIVELRENTLQFG
jgi:hypothetical protein